MKKEKKPITNHELIPKHILLSDKEKEELLQNYNIDIFQLPKILKKDPAIKDLKPKPGTIVKILRKSPTSGESVFYRVVIDG